MKNKFLYIKEGCSICSGKGYIWSDKRHFRGEVEVDPIQCECLKKMMLYMTLDNANVPRDYFDLNIDGFKSREESKIAIKNKVAGIINTIDSFRTSGKSLFFYGPNGTGKTMLAIEILKAAMRKKASIYYDFFPIVYNEFSKKGYKSDEVKDRYAKIFNDTDFLVLDELGKEKEYFHADKDTASRFLELNILKHRVSKPTILISNCPNGMSDIDGYYDQHVKSMLSLNYEFVYIAGADFRQAGRNND